MIVAFNMKQCTGTAETMPKVKSINSFVVVDFSWFMFITLSGLQTAAKEILSAPSSPQKYNNSYSIMMSYFCGGKIRGQIGCYQYKLSCYFIQASSFSFFILSNCLA